MGLRALAAVWPLRGGRAAPPTLSLPPRPVDWPEEGNVSQVVATPIVDHHHPTAPTRQNYRDLFVLFLLFIMCDEEKS